MTETGMPKIDTSGEGDGTAGGGGAGGVHWVKLVRAVTSVEYHPCTGVLHIKADIVKFNNDRVRFSRARRRTETRLVTKSGDTRILDIWTGVEVDGKDI